MKKTFGVLLILLGLLLTIVILFGTLPLIFKDTSRILREQSAGHIGYLIGFMIFAILNFALYFFGFKLLRSKKKETLIPDEDFPSQLNNPI